jgi:hypothetical protein
MQQYKHCILLIHDGNYLQIVEDYARIFPCAIYWGRL